MSIPIFVLSFIIGSLLVLLYIERKKTKSLSERLKKTEPVFSRAHNIHHFGAFYWGYPLYKWLVLEEENKASVQTLRDHLRNEEKASYGKMSSELAITKSEVERLSEDNKILRRAITLVRSNDE
jgi:hypothetical protein